MPCRSASNPRSSRGISVAFDIGTPSAAVPAFVSATPRRVSGSAGKLLPSCCGSQVWKPTNVGEGPPSFEAIQPKALQRQGGECQNDNGF
jgi:hypothetical protein